jgi:hypothetical protein
MAAGDRFEGKWARSVGCAIALACLGACGGGGGDPSNSFVSTPPPNNSNWTPGVFLPSSQFQDQCARPRTGVNSQGRPYPDRQGSVGGEQLASLLDERAVPLVRRGRRQESGALLESARLLRPAEDDANHTVWAAEGQISFHLADRRMGVVQPVRRDGGLRCAIAGREQPTASRSPGAVRRSARGWCRGDSDRHDDLRQTVRVLPVRQLRYDLLLRAVQRRQ